MEAIFRRRSVRKYEDKLVEKEKIEKLLRAAMQAPSAGNQQAWEFLVIENKENLKKLSLTSPYTRFLEQSNLAIIVLANKKRLKFDECWEQDMSAATQNILLEAVTLDLGAVWLGVAPLEERMDCIRKIFVLGKELLPFSIISIGYPQEKDANKFMDRYDEKKIHFEKY